MTHINAITAGAYLFEMEDEAASERSVWVKLVIYHQGGFLAQFYRKDPHQHKQQIRLGSVTIDYFNSLISALKFDPETESQVLEEFTIVEEIHEDEENKEAPNDVAQ